MIFIALLNSPSTFPFQLVLARNPRQCARHIKKLSTGAAQNLIFYSLCQSMSSIKNVHKKQKFSFKIIQ
jgi:hypothetical protein